MMSILNNNHSDGLLESLFNTKDISAIFVNAPDLIYVKQKDKLQKVVSPFKDTEALWAGIHDFLKPFGFTVNPEQTLWQTRLPTGAWVNILASPAVANGPVLTIRKPGKLLTIQDLIHFGCLSSEAADFLKACVKAKLNILVSGGPNSGKTTTLNILADFIPDDTERIITIEQTGGLALQHKHVVSLTVEAGAVEKSNLSKADLMSYSADMMPDRIIVTELEGSEVIPLLQTAPEFDGIMASIFAMHPQEAITRLELLMMQADPSLPESLQRNLIATGFDMVVQINRLRDGSRKVMKITEVAGIKEDAVNLTDIFVYQETGMADGRINGRTIATGAIPGFLSRLEAAGFSFSLDFLLQQTRKSDI